MIQSTYRFSLDIHEEHSNVCLHVKKGDTNSRKLFVTLTEEGFPYEISEDCYAVFTATKHDGKVLYNDCVIDDDTIIYELTPQTTAASGVMDCEIQLYGANDALLTSPRFLIVVDDTVYDTETEIESTEEYAALLDLISKIGGLQIALPSPSSAEVGQVIMVKAVDSKGKVIATVAMDNVSRTPVKGVDYFTNAEIEEIVEAVLAKVAEKMPQSGGVSIFTMISRKNIMRTLAVTSPTTTMDAAVD